MTDLTAPDEILYRQIHPDFIDEGVPSSDRFRPSTRDAGKLSLDRGATCTASESHALYTGSGKLSAAVFGVAVGEFEEERVSCVEDPVPATNDAPANPHHALADFSNLDLKSQKHASKRLARKAVERGVLHPVPSTEAGEK